MKTIRRTSLFLQCIKFILITSIVFVTHDYVIDQQALSMTAKPNDVAQMDIDTSFGKYDMANTIDLRDHIYLVATNDVSYNKPNGSTGILQKDSFIIYDERTHTSLTHGHIIQSKGLVKIPKGLAQSNFNIQFSLKNINVSWVDVYKTVPLTKGTLADIKNLAVKREIPPFSMQYTSDMNLYQGKYIHATIDNENYYIPLELLDIKIASIRKLNLSTKILGSSGKHIAKEKPTNISLNITDKTNLSGEEIDKALHGTNLSGLGQAFANMEEQYGVNALFAISVAVHESGWGRSHLAQSRNNLFGIAAYDGNEGAAYSFSSKESCIDHWGEMIRDVYFKRGYTTIASVNSIYASDKRWASKVERTMVELKSKIIS